MALSGQDWVTQVVSSEKNVASFTVCSRLLKKWHAWPARIIGRVWVSIRVGDNSPDGVCVRHRGWPTVWDIEWAVEYSALGLPNYFSVPEKEKRTSQSQLYSYSHAKEVEPELTSEKIKSTDAVEDVLPWQHIAYMHTCRKLSFWGNGPLPTWQTSKHLFIRVLSIIKKTFSFFDGDVNAAET